MKNSSNTLLDWEPRGDNAIPYYPTPDMCSEIVDWMEMLHNIDDASGIMRRYVIILPEASLSYTQLPETNLGSDRDGHG